MLDLATQIEQIEVCAQTIAQRLPRAEIAVVLGSGLGALADMMKDTVVLPYAEIPHFPQPTVLGHSGKLISGLVGGKRVYAFSGRFHYYEGHDPQTVILPMRVLQQLGCQTVILTNAAGGVNMDFHAGELMLITDHINLTGYNPLRGANDERWGARFPDMTYTYDPALRDLALCVANELGITLQQGVYCGLCGPSFETPAEIRMLRLLGADAVGMSTVPEAIAARQMGMRLLAISCITNMAAGVLPQPLSHEEVFATGKQAEKHFSALVEGIIRRI